MKLVVLQNENKSTAISHLTSTSGYSMWHALPAHWLRNLSKTRSANSVIYANRAYIEFYSGYSQLLDAFYHIKCMSKRREVFNELRKKERCLLVSKACLVGGRNYFAKGISIRERYSARKLHLTSALVIYGSTIHRNALSIIISSEEENMY